MPRECLVCPRLARYESCVDIGNLYTHDACVLDCPRLTLTRRLLSSEEDRLPVAERADNRRLGRAHYTGNTY